MENSDWANNSIYGANSSAYKLTPRYKSAQKMVNKALKKYTGFRFESTGHSQAGLLSHLLGTKAVNNIQLNPAYKDETLKNS